MRIVLTVMILIISLNSQAVAFNLTCTPWVFADGSPANGESFVLLQDGTGFKMPRGDQFQKFEFVSEDLPYRKMYVTNFGGLSAVFLLPLEDDNPNILKLVMADPWFSGYQKSNCTKF